MQVLRHGPFVNGRVLENTQVSATRKKFDKQVDHAQRVFVFILFPAFWITFRESKVSACLCWTSKMCCRCEGMDQFVQSIRTCEQGQEPLARLSSYSDTVRLPVSLIIELDHRAKVKTRFWQCQFRPERDVRLLM